jgi:hypothetical protein
MKEQETEVVVTVCGGYVDSESKRFDLNKMADCSDLEIGGSEKGDRVKAGGELQKRFGLFGFFTGAVR